MSLSEISDAYRAEQLRLDQAAARKLAEVFPALSLRDLDRTAPAWMAAAESAALEHYARSQSLAADDYTDVRRDVGVTSRLTVVRDPADRARVRASLLWGGPQQAKRMMSDGQKMPEAARRAFAQSTTSALRLGRNGGRDVITRTAAGDSAATGRYGYIRQTGAKPCGFCVTIALQVYRSEESAMAGYHDSCQCRALPRLRDALPEGYADRMDELTDVYVENRATKRNKSGREVVDAKQTIRNMNSAMRERNGA